MTRTRRDREREKRESQREREGESVKETKAGGQRPRSASTRRSHSQQEDNSRARAVTTVKSNREAKRLPACTVANSSASIALLLAQHIFLLTVESARTINGRAGLLGQAPPDLGRTPVYLQPRAERGTNRKSANLPLFGRRNQFSCQAISLHGSTVYLVHGHRNSPESRRLVEGVVLHFQWGR